jgi:hypothetical protein
MPAVKLGQETLVWVRRLLGSKIAVKTQRETKLKRSRRVAIIATILAGILLKITCEKMIVLWSTGTPTATDMNVAVLSCIGGLIALYVAVESAR